MCGRYARYGNKQRYAEWFGLPGTDDPRNYVGDIHPSWNVAPSQISWIIQERFDAPPLFEGASWGLVTGWAKTPKDGPRPINARSEEAASKPMFRRAMKVSRCVVPADGFYEWKVTPAGKVPHFIRLPDDEPMAMAGLYEAWQAPDSATPVLTYAILTTAPNEFMRSIHDRMPVILHPKDVMRWIDRSQQDPAKVADVLRPYDGPMQAWAVSRRVNSPKNNDAELIGPE